MLLDAMMGIHPQSLIALGLVVLVIVLVFLAVRAFVRGVCRGMRDQQ